MTALLKAYESGEKEHIYEKGAIEPSFQHDKSVGKSKETETEKAKDTKEKSGVFNFMKR